MCDPTADRRRWTKRLLGGHARKGVRVLLLLVATSGVATIGCQSGPFLALTGARHYAAGNRALDRGDTEVAIAEFSAAALRVPHASEIQNHLGLAYWQAGRTAQARGAFEAALSLDCENEAAQHNLARLIAEDGAREGGESHGR